MNIEKLLSISRAQRSYPPQPITVSQRITSFLIFSHIYSTSNAVIGQGKPKRIAQQNL